LRERIRGHDVENLQRVRTSGSGGAYVDEQVDQGAVGDRVAVEPYDEESPLAGRQFPKGRDSSRRF
jgi:hypothetical protein